jgi:hypothetical protein
MFSHFVLELLLSISEQEHNDGGIEHCFSWVLNVSVNADFFLVLLENIASTCCCFHSCFFLDN